MLAARSEVHNKLHVLIMSRRFSKEPPKGKGNRVTAESGLLTSGRVQLSGILLYYKQHWEYNINNRAAVSFALPPPFLTQQGTHMEP